MQFIVSGQRIAVENFVTGKLYNILFKNDTQVNITCTSIGADCVVFQGEAPLNLFTLTMQNADTIDTIEPTQLGTTNYNNLINKPSINGVDLIGNKTNTQLGIRDVPAIIEADDGKVLTAASDGSYSWQELPEGTTDYTDLSNKPQINDVTLTGNVSLSDLGAAAASDIPTTPGDIGAEPVITSENKLDPALIAYDSSHAAITSAQVSQIGTNETNISNIQTKLNNLYVQSSEPTGTIPDGAIWINTATPTPLSDYIKKYHIITIDAGDFEQGTLAESSAVGSTYEQTKSSTQANRIRSTDCIALSGDFTISVDFSTYQIYMLYYDDNQQYTGQHTSDWQSAPITVSNKPYIGIIIRRLDNNNISPTDNTGIEIINTTKWHSNNT